MVSTLCSPQWGNACVCELKWQTKDCESNKEGGSVREREFSIEHMWAASCRLQAHLHTHSYPAPPTITATQTYQRTHTHNAHTHELLT